MEEQQVYESEGPFPGPATALYRRSVLPPADRPAWARLGVLHGYGDHSGRFREVMCWLAARGMACHALDFRGHGRAAGRRTHVADWDDYLDDLDAFLALPELAEAAGPPRFLLGHSHGGLILAAAGERGLTDVRGCVFSAPYFRGRQHIPVSKRLFARTIGPLLPWIAVPSGLRDEWMTTDEEMLRETKADPLIVRTATPGWFLGSLAAQQRILAAADRFRLPYLMLIGDADPLSDPEAARSFHERSGAADRTLEELPGLLHELLRERGREAVFERILRWLRERAG